MYSDPIVVEKKKCQTGFKFPEYLKDEPPFNPPDVPGSTLEEMPITIVPRSAWGARPPSSQLPLHLPVTKVKFSNEDVYKRHEYLTKALLLTQEYYIDELKEPDVPFNFLVDEGGLIYEGRGWKTRPRYTSKGDNVLEIAFIGAYENPSETPTFAKCEAAHSLLLKGVREHLIDKNFAIVSMKDRTTFPQEELKWFPIHRKEDPHPFADVKPYGDFDWPLSSD